MLITFVTILVAIIAILLMGAVLVQNPKGGGIDSSLGGAANNFFGAAQSADFIEKLTWYLGAALMALCLLSTFIR